jgi:hypothetical protein
VITRNDEEKRMNKIAYATLVGCLGSMIGCGEKITYEQHSDAGHVCVTVAAGNVVNATVHFGCITGGNTSLEEAECSMELDGSNLIVTAEAWTKTVHRTFSTDECGLPTTECSLSDVPDGDYTVTYGGFSTDLTVSGSPGAEVCTDS